MNEDPEPPDPDEAEDMLTEASHSKSSTTGDSESTDHQSATTVAEWIKKHSGKIWTAGIIMLILGGGNWISVLGVVVAFGSVVVYLITRGIPWRIPGR